MNTQFSPPLSDASDGSDLLKGYVGESVEGINYYDNETLPLMNNNEITVPKGQKPGSNGEGIKEIRVGVEIDPEFLKKRNGSVFQAIFNFSNAPLGAGMLSFPYTYYCTGFISGLILSFIIITLSLLTLYILVNASFHATDPKTGLPGLRSYQDCIEYYLGGIWKKLSEVTMLFYAIGACMVYFVVIGEFIEPVAALVLPEWLFLTKQKVIIVVFAFIIVFPLLMPRQMKVLSYTSFLAVICAWVLSIFMFVTFVQHVSLGDIGPGTDDLMFIQGGLYSNIYPLFFLAVPIQCFGYMGHVLLFPMIYEVKKPKLWKYILIIVVSICGISFIYLMNGISGWYAFGINVQDNILNNFSGRNIGANVVRFLCGVNLIFSFPIQNYGARLTINSILFNDSNRENGVPFYLFLNLCLFFLTLACALLIPGLSIIFSFVGAIGAVTLIFFFPALLCFTAMIKETDDEKKWKEEGVKPFCCCFKEIMVGSRCVRGYLSCRKICWIATGICLLVLAVFFAVTGVIASVFKFIDAINKHQF